MNLTINGRELTVGAPQVTLHELWVGGLSLPPHPWGEGDPEQRSFEDEVHGSERFLNVEALHEPAGGSSKFQTPNPKKAPNPKLQWPLATTEMALLWSFSKLLERLEQCGPIQQMFDVASALDQPEPFAIGRSVGDAGIGEAGGELLFG